MEEGGGRDRGSGERDRNREEKPERELDTNDTNHDTNDGNTDKKYKRKRDRSPSKEKATRREDKRICSRSEAKEERVERARLALERRAAQVKEQQERYQRRPAWSKEGAGERIDQQVEWVKTGADKMQKLVELLYGGIDLPIMVYTNQKKNCDTLSCALNELGFRSIALHSGKTLEQREHALNAFQCGEYKILVTTDISARGIDIRGVRHVINYDMPNNIVAYVFRVGRTSRAGREGTSISFLTPEDTGIMYDLRNMLFQSGNPIPQELSQHPASQTRPV